jgi:S-DNA-T family DNA segregation ATPase FtsK/SpoIIIE
LSALEQISVTRRQQILGLLLVALGFLALLALFTLARAPGPLVASLPRDACGPVGVLLARLLAFVFGRVLALAVPIAIIAWGMNRLLLRPTTALLARSLAAGALVLFLAGILGVSHDRDGFWVGILGQAIGVKATDLLGRIGAYVVLWTGLLVAVLAFLDLGLADLLGALGSAWAWFRAKLAVWRAAFTTRAGAPARPGGALSGPVTPPAPERGAPPRAAAPAPADPLPVSVSVSASVPASVQADTGIAAASAIPGAAAQLKDALFDLRKRRRAERDLMAAAIAADSSPPRVKRPEDLALHPGMDAQAPVAPAGEGNGGDAPPENGRGAKRERALGEKSGRIDRAEREEKEAKPAADRAPLGNGDSEGAPGGAAAGGDGAASDPTDLEPAAPRTPASPRAARKSTPSAPPRPERLPRPRGTDYALPALDLLATSTSSAPPIAEAEILKSSRLLEQTLSHFDITGKVTEVVPGPVITRYAFEPAPGVKVNQILSRADDLALALRAHRLRLLAPIPGKGAVGIEVPNLHPETVQLGDVVGVELFQRPGGLLLALGKDVSGVPVVADLKRMPHLLIAGATGSGKSVCVNSIVLSLLCRMNPRDLRLVMVDPKMLELTGYNGIPQLLMPVVTEARSAAKALRFLVAEMQRRYQRLARRGVRDIESYNASLDQHVGLTPEVPEDEGHLPYIVVLIDELADLMLTLGNEIEDPIARLAQMARAVGIHLVLATQRPSVDVITGMIKANFPSRIAFQVASKVDSRTILDQNGAEALLGRGDMLYLPAGRPDPVRIHGAFVSDREIQAVVRHWSDFEAPTPELDVERLSLRDENGEMADESEEDELFAEARRIVVQTGIGSTSLLQRRLKVGYARAGRLMDLLEQAGVVGPPDGSRAREVIMRPGDLPD